MEHSGNEVIDDGFESCEEDRVELSQDEVEAPSEHQIVVSQKMIKYIPPPQEIKDKPYSLQPDMRTGWMPKVSLPQPVPLTFPQDQVAEILSAYSRAKPAKAQLVYLGPRFDNTYSAWKTFGVEFPYNHLGSQRMVLTDRIFQGMLPFYPQREVRFESQFESGNLDAVWKVDQNEFDCFMRVDANTRGHLHWYYFKMFNLRRNQAYRINICNFQKAKSLYSRGMSPYIFSHRRNEDTREGWLQQGTNIEYEKRKSKTHKALFGKEEEEEQDKFYTLSFELECEYEDDTIEIAYCPPYTFTKLSNHLRELASTHQGRNILVLDSLCLSLSGLRVPLLTVTNQAEEAEADFKQQKVYKDKHLIFVMGRIHPGESNGSYVMEGFLNWITGLSAEAEELRGKYLFKIVPMANPDGVIIGNYRTGLSGRDFNRQFIDPDPVLFVEVDQLKRYLQRCKWTYQKGFNFFLDFHGHSVKKNAFAYGPQFPLTHSKYYESRLLPKLLSKRTEVFRYYSCVFKVSEYKASTARAIVLRQLSIPFSYTIEASNGSYFDYETKERQAFTIQKWASLGVRICETLFDYWTVYKEIQEVRLKRKQERQTFLKSKGGVSRKVQSSSFRSKTANFEKRAKVNFKSGASITENRGSSILNEILNEITHEEVKEQDRCSDDMLSEGGSDSEASCDDIDLTSVRAILTGKQDEKRRVRRIKTKEEPLTEAKQERSRETVVRYSSSFLTDVEEESPQSTRRPPIIERKRRPTCIYRKIFTMSGGSASPPPQQSQKSKKDLNGTTKIINLNFMLNPVAISSTAQKPERRQFRAKTETNEGELLRNELADNARKTFTSIQRQCLKKELGKRMSLNSQNLTVSQFKNQQVVGRRIFTQT